MRSTALCSNSSCSRRLDREPRRLLAARIVRVGALAVRFQMPCERDHPIRIVVDPDDGHAARRGRTEVFVDKRPSLQRPSAHGSLIANASLSKSEHGVSEGCFRRACDRKF